VLPDDETPFKKPQRHPNLEDWLPFIVGVIGLGMAFHPMFRSGFGTISGESGDSRLINYLLEHSYRWVGGNPIHRVFWDPPFYYPARNVLAHSDLLVGSGPPYWACRILGASPDTAFQLWMLAVSALNFACGYLLFRGGLRCGKPAAMAAAFLIAFGAPRINQQIHQQLIPCFYVLLAIYALARIFSKEEPALGHLRRLALWLLAVLATVGQCYSGFYQGWFLIWSLALAGLAALSLPSCRGNFLLVLVRDTWAILIASIVGGLVIRPLVSHYRQADQELHQGYYPMIPSFWSWLNIGPNSWLWGWTADFNAFRTLPWGIEDRLGFGFITPVVCLAGLYLGRNRTSCRLAMLVLLGWFFCIARFPFGGDAMANLAMAIAAIGMVLLYRTTDEPGPRLLTAIGLVAFLNLISFPNPILIMTGLFAIGLVVVEIFRLSDDPARQVGPWLALLGLCCPVFYWQILLTVLAVLLPFWLFAEYKRVYRPGQIRALAAFVLVAILVPILNFTSAKYLAALTLGPALLLVAIPKNPNTFRLPVWIPAWVVLGALFAIVYCYHADSLWNSISRDVPGGHAIRGVGRVILVLLVPLAVGLVSFLTSLEARGRTILAWSIAILCLVEQGISAPTYNKREQRDRVSRIASRVDPRCEAFFYHTRRDGSWIAYVDYQLDAMWASLESGKPTINGYTSVWPRDWIELRVCAFLPDPEVREALYDWARSRNLDLHGIEWINEDSGPMRFSPFFGSKPGDPEVPGEPREKESEALGVRKP